MSFVLTDEQEQGIKAAKEWYLSNSNEPFVFMGCAGSGKSTVVKFIIENLGIDPVTNVRYVTYTGKAASVLLKKGNPATTIHKLIYDPVFDENNNIKEFTLKKSLDPSINLIVIDEFYMVSDEIMKDILSFKIKVICLGDDNQLPPPFGKVSNLAAHPNARLTKPLRQSLDNPIIYLANQVINHKMIRIGSYGSGVEVVTKDNLSIDKLCNADQIIAGKNMTVKKFNKFYRQRILGINKDIWIPQKHEKLIALQNNWNLTCTEDKLNINFVNGLNCILEKELEYNTFTEISNGDFRPEFFSDHCFKHIPIDMLYFKHGFTKEEEIYDKNNIMKFDFGKTLNKRKKFLGLENKLNKMTFGYCITCHKSQGSEWDEVYFIFEPFKNARFDIYWQMLYTGLTRASKKITIAI